jgi:Skp family chaperone for outer membrane proteins
MALSEQLLKLADEVTKLASRAAEAETRAAEARDKTKADLEHDIAATRASAQTQADKLRAIADEAQGNVSAGWTDLQRSWDEHFTDFRKQVETKKTELDVHVAERRAETAEADARFAVDFAYSAVVEAEYAVLDAALARMEADELTASGSAA